MESNLVNTIYGPISADFIKSALGELCVPDTGIQTGPFGSQLHASDYVDHGTPIITVEHLGDNRIIHANLPRVSDKDKERLSKYTLQTGDIAFSRVGSVDRRAIVRHKEEGWLFSGRCLRVRPDKEKIDPGYLSWFFGFPGFQEYIRQIAVGATMPSLNTTILSNVPIYYPRLCKEQQAIAHILGTLDDKIELNRQMNQTLEAIARAIFKSWFVDFDPVRAKMNSPSPDGRGVRGEGIRPATHTNTPIPTDILDFARQMRRQATDAEALLWRLLRGRRIANAKFRRQHFFPPYILDFYCYELKLAVELDGGQHNLEAGRQRDARRDAYLAEHGIQVLRFWNNDVLREIEAVLEAIYAAVMERVNAVPSPPAPLPGGEGSYPQHILDLFPDRLVDSELGEIPKGWKVGTLAQVCELAYGKALSAKQRQLGNIPVMGSNGQLDFHNEALVKGPGIIVGRKGNPGIVTWVNSDFYPIDTTFYVVSRSICPLTFLAYALENLNLPGLGADSAVPGLNRNIAYMSQMVIPVKPILQVFDKQASTIRDRQDALVEESRTLSSLRDALLPKLICGELPISGAERIIGRCV